MTVPIAEVASNAPHNNAYDSILTRAPARVFEWLAEPLIEHVYGPIAEKSHIAGVIAANATLTLPRLPIDRAFGQMYESALAEDSKSKAALAIGGKLITKAVDGIDGPVTRGTNTTTLIGAGLDPLVDMSGTLDDALIVRRQARCENDLLTEVLVDLRIATDVGVMVMGGVLNTAADKYAESRGVVLGEREKSKANAMGKLKFGLSIVGGTALLGSYTSPDTSVGKSMKRTGQVLTGASIAAGAVSIYQYGRSAVSKIRRARQQSKADNTSTT
jgi:phosphatidylglycerophosphate synthase